MSEYINFETFFRNELLNKGYSNLDEDQARIVFNALNDDWEDSFRQEEKYREDMIEQKDIKINEQKDELNDLRTEVKNLDKELEVYNSEFNDLPNGGYYENSK